jgi:radical SAM superfamily enzyme YgiQ (UPF0313 family)/selenocysteine lyase/cysteine desulfurase
VPRLNAVETDLESVGPESDPLARNLCHIGDSRPGKRVWFVLAPYGGAILRFRGEPTSLLYAIAPLVDEIRRGRVSDVTPDDLALLNPPGGGSEFHREFEARLRQQRLRLLCISTLTAAYGEARTLAAIAKRVDPRIVVVFGGPHEDDAPHPAASADPNVDFSVRGDGENALLEIARLVLSREHLPVDEIKARLLDLAHFEYPMPRIEHPGRAVIAFRETNHRMVEVLCARGQGRDIEGLDLDSIPRMPRELLLEEDTRQFSIFRRQGKNLRTAQIMTHRGCHWNCSFCSESAQHQPNRKVTSRSVESVIAEIEAVRDLGYEAIFFDDSTFTFHSARRQEFLAHLYAYLGRQAPQLEWGCQTRVDQVKLAELREMKYAGCSYIYLGVESSSAEMLRQMNKHVLPTGQERTTLGDAFNAINDVRMRVGVSLIFGVASPNHRETAETRDTIIETLEFIRCQTEFGNIALVSLNLATYYPATRMTRESGQHLDFMQPIRHRGYPWNRYEEGEGQHPEGVDREMAEFIIREAISRLGEYLMDQDLYAVDEVLLPYRNARLPRQRVIYLNHAALTHPLRGAVTAAARRPTPSHPLFVAARRTAAELFGLSTSLVDRVALARNTTEATALALYVTGLNPADPVHILTTNAENPSIQRVFRFSMDHGNPQGRDLWSTFQDFGTREDSEESSEREPTKFAIDTIDVLDGPADLVESIHAALTPETQLVVVSHVVRDDGRILDVKAICRSLRKARPDLWILVDGAQALGALPTVDFDGIGCDFYVATPHKTLGSYPLGLLCFGERARREIMRADARLSSRTRIFRGMFDPALPIPPTTAQWLSAAEAASFTAAVAELHERGLVVGNNASALDAHRALLRSAFEEVLRSQASADPVILSSGEAQSNFILSFRFPGTDNRAVAERLWRDFWIPVSYIARSDVIRVSFGPDNTLGQVQVAATAVATLINESGPTEPAEVESASNLPPLPLYQIAPLRGRAVRLGSRVG